MVKPVKRSSSSSSCNDRRHNNNSLNKNKLSVYDFNDEDQLVEKDSQKILSKFKRNPSFNCNKFSSSPVDKYSFLRSFTQGTKTVDVNSSIKPVDIDNSFDAMEERIYNLDADVSGHSDCKLSAHAKRTFPGETHCTREDRKPGKQPLSVGSEDERGSDEVLCNGPICLDSDDDLETKCGSSISSSDFAGDEGSLEEQTLSHVSTVVGGEVAVIVKPDCIICGNLYSTTSQLTFSNKAIKLEGSTLCGTKRSFSFNWSIRDLLKISSLWCREVETATFDLYLKCEDEKPAAIESMFSGTVKLTFFVNDPQWSEKQQAIESLDLRYKASWSTVVDIDPMESEFPSPVQKSMSFSRDSVPNCDSSDLFEDFIYPQGEPDAVSISKKDIELLQPATFINDTIIDFYVKYLEQNIRPEEKHRFHFFNCFFFRKLADLDKDQSTSCGGRAAFQRVRKWTRKVNLFEKDYLFIPVNFSLHWSLIVVCHPGEVAYYKGEMVDKSVKVPCILHMDSIRGIHRGLKNLFQTYLLEEWKERHSELSEDVSTNFLNLPFVSLELPQQENSFDCGLFLLYYVERFLQQAPVNFNLSNEASNFLNKEWFHPAEASRRREYMKNLIYKVSDGNAHQESAAANEFQYSSHCMVEGEVGDESLRETCDVKDARQGCYNAPLAAEGIRVESQAATPIGTLYPLGQPNLVSGDILGEGHMEWSVAKQTHQYQGKSDQACNNMSPIEEEDATSEQKASVHKVAGKQAVASVSRNTMLLDFEDVEILDVRSLNSLEMQDEEAVDSRVQHFLHSETMDNMDERIDTSSMSREELECCVVEDSLEENGMSDTNDSENPHSCEATTMAMHDLEVESPTKTGVKVTTMALCDLEVESPSNTNVRTNKRAAASEDDRSNVYTATGYRTLFKRFPKESHF